MKTYLNFLWISILLVFVLSGCSSESQKKRHTDFQQWIEENGKIKVLSTTGMINDLVDQIGGEHVDAMTLIQGDLDPHSYQLVKGDDEKLAYADVIFYNGLGLEHGPSLYHFLNENHKAIPLGDLIYKEEPHLIVTVKGVKDPHIWMDVSIWAKTVPLIVKTLSQKDPVHAVDYEQKGHALMNEMDKVHQEVKSILHKVPAHQRFLVTSHDAFNYFTRAYLAEDDEIESGRWEVRFAAPEGLAPESQLSVSDIKYIIDHIKTHHIYLIFPESNVSRDSIRKIVQASQEQGHPVNIACCPLYGDAMGKPGSEGDSYLKMILYNARTLSTHLDSNHLPK